MRLILGSGLLLWIGSALLLADVRWFARPRLVERLRLYHPGATAGARPSVLSAASFRDVIGPLSRVAGERLAKVFGVSEELAVRLERIHSPLDVTAFRVRQVGWAAAALGVAALATTAA